LRAHRRPGIFGQNPARPIVLSAPTRERLHRLALDGRRVLRPGIAASGYVAGEIRAMEETRTLALSPDFADTKLRDLDNSRLVGSFQVEIDDPATGWADRLLVGTDWSAGRLATEHHAVFSGDEDAYRASGSPSPELDARGTASRFGAALFARYDVLPVEALRLSIGGRVDWLRDTFQPRAPSEGERLDAEHLAVSPKLGLNFRYVRTERQEGHVFASAGQSFKAPTPDQLFDQRSIPVPFPPFAITISNELLRPQYGTGFEAGLYHGTELVTDGLSADLSLSAYQIDMRDELDFSFEEFRYVNIGRSRHRGIESGLRLRGPSGVSAFAGYTLQSVTSRAGENAGRYVKAVPRHVLSGDLQARHRLGLAGSIGVVRADGMYLDDANTVELPGFTRVDARVTLPVRRMQLAVQVFNVLDSEYSTTGYPDPAGSGAIYYYPAAGRILQVGVTTAW
jgi:outer membrane receptor protein involved in Fe transport